jgi:hypothetical protein
MLAAVSNKRPPVLERLKDGELWICLRQPLSNGERSRGPAPCIAANIAKLSELLRRASTQAKPASVHQLALQIRTAAVG